MKIVIGLPGDSFSEKFLQCWTGTVVELMKNGHQITIAPGVSSFVSFARMKTLGLDVMRGEDQKPFNGNTDYDLWITLDSDMVFKPSDVLELINATERYPVVAGYYMMSNGTHFATVKKWDPKYFKQNGTFQFMTQADIDAEKETFIPVSYVGLGFFACRRHVLEALRYPYFDAPLQKFTKADGTVLKDMCSEDVAFCKNIQAAGFDVMLHTKLRIGHEKRVVL
jgi:hypothetical protein